MKKITSLISLLFLLLVFVSGCATESEDTINPRPVVKKTSANYTRASFSAAFPDTVSLRKMSEAYSNNFSEETRNKILDYMRGEVSKLGEDTNVFENILSRTGCKISGEYLLPTYAERAKYENREAWIFQLTYGLGESGFGHYKCFAFSTANNDTLVYISCR
jgi:hypothetical protein